MPVAVVIGAGPAGLMAAEQLGLAGVAVTLAEAMPSPGRKFLMAGKSGLNLTKDEAEYLPPYGALSPDMAAALGAFGPQAVMEWARGLGQEVFTGSTGRVFPVAMKASTLLRAWLHGLAGRGVVLRTGWRWTGWEDGALVFETGAEREVIRPDVTVLALGGASWARLGADGQWAALLPGEVAPFRPANMGFVVAWSPHMDPWLGQPVKGCALMAGGKVERGEFVISRRGIEGGGIYAVSAAVRDGAPLWVDLMPDVSLADVAARIARPRGKASLATHMRKALRLDGIRMALLNEFGRPFPGDLAALIKRLPIRHAGPRPMDEAISTAGGLRFDALEGWMLKAHPGVFACGEMLDWEAPTGGYLITGCLASGMAAGRAAADYALARR